MAPKPLTNLADRFRAEAEEDVNFGLLASADPMQAYLDAIVEAIGAGHVPKISVRPSAFRSAPNSVEPSIILNRRLPRKRDDHGIGAEQLEGALVTI